MLICSFDKMIIQNFLLCWNVDHSRKEKVPCAYVASKYDGDIIFEGNEGSILLEENVDAVV